MNLAAWIGALVALGHAALMVWAVNVSHGLGIRDRGWTVYAKLLMLLAMVGLTALMGWGLYSAPVRDWRWPYFAYALACLTVALAVLPLATLARHLRRTPGGIRGRDAVIDLAREHGKDALIGDHARSWMLRLPGNDSLRLRKAEWEVPLAGLPQACDGLSLLHLSDFHLARCYRRAFFEAVVEASNGWEVDLVFFTGDLIDDDGAFDWVVPLISRLRGRLGKFGILGNHDYDHHPSRIRRAFAGAGWSDVEGRWAEADVEGSRWAIGGTSAPWGPRLDLRGAPDADFRVLLSHSPDRFPSAARAGMDLVLSGHNHGGQVRLPVVGPILMPSIYSRRFDRGFFRSGRTTMHVSVGVAGKDPIRYGCVPEISRLVLRVAPPDATAPRAAHLVGRG